jgi:hypothetical protein
MALMTNDKQQTALHRYSRGVGELVSQLIGDRITGKQFVMLEIKLMDECKEIEKNQIVDAVDSWIHTGNMKGETYYEQTYGGDKQ